MGDIEGYWIIPLTQISFPQDRKTPVETVRLLWTTHLLMKQENRDPSNVSERATAIQRSKRQYWKECTIVTIRIRIKFIDLTEYPT
jgi:hypothetical protein